MTVVMLLLMWLFGVATPLVIFGDRLSVFIPADAFLSLMGRVGGYNHMKQLGVASVISGQLLLGTSMMARTGSRRSSIIPGRN